MKWMLFLLVLGHPVETNLIFDNLNACFKAEEAMRKEYAKASGPPSRNQLSHPQSGTVQEEKS